MSKLQIFAKLILLFTLLLLLGCQSVNSRPSILYLAWDSTETLQLFSQIGHKPSTQITTQPEGVIEYALSTDGSQIVYVTPDETDGSLIWLMSRNGRTGFTEAIEVTHCNEAQCRNLLWASDGRRLIFEKRTRSSQNSIPTPPTLWWLDTETGETAVVLPDSTHPNMAASLSTNDEWLTYAVPSEESLYSYSFANGDYFFVHSVTGTPASWHPNGTQFVVSDIDLVVKHGDEGDDHLEHGHEYSEAIHLFLVDVATQQQEKLTEAAQMDDGAAVFSPDGEWIVFGRKLVRTNTGRQLWLMRSDGSEKRPLTDHVATHHGAVSWSEDGRFLLYQMVDTTAPNPIPSIWMMEVESGEMTLLVEEGVLPTWLD